MKRLVVTILLTVSLVGCAGQTTSPWLVTREHSKPKECQPLTNDQELVLGLSQEIANSGRLHAALANLERLPERLPEARLRKAQLLRVLGRSEAEKLYADLVNSCLAAEAHHGLGQIAVARKNYNQALKHLRIATSLSPANDAMRNDLGVTYLNLDRIAEANFELMTAMELNEGDSRAAQNMLTLLIYQDKWQNARHLVTSKKLTTEQFREAERRARALQAEKAQLQKNKTQTSDSRSQPAVIQPAAVTAQPSPAPVQPRVSNTPTAAQVARPSQAPAQSDPAATRPTQAPLQSSQTSTSLDSSGGVRGVQRVPSAGARPVRPITGY